MASCPARLKISIFENWPALADAACAAEKPTTAAPARAKSSRLRQQQGMPRKPTHPIRANQTRYTSTGDTVGIGGCVPGGGLLQHNRGLSAHARARHGGRRRGGREPKSSNGGGGEHSDVDTTTIEIGEVTQMWNRQFMVWGKVTYQLPSYVLQAASWSTSLFSSLSYAPSPSRLPGAAAT